MDDGAKLAQGPIEVALQVSRNHPPRGAQDPRRSLTLALLARALDHPDRERRQRRIVEPRSDALDGAVTEGGEPVAPLDAPIGGRIVGFRQEGGELHRTLQRVAVPFVQA